jgi:peptidoglycan/LPS O-acetylase OafA/YrhL
MANSGHESPVPKKAAERFRAQARAPVGRKIGFLQSMRKVDAVKNRIEYLDGHRGLAILLVIGFHAYARWPSLVPYDNAYGNIPLFRFGWLGVELFFLVSGFVILMTLENCASAGEFMFRRWLRLFPAMLFCSLLIFFTSGVFFERPDGAPSAASLLPGLTFMEPSWWQSVLGIPVKPLEGGFWTLYVELKFYIFAAIVYFWRGRNWMLGALIGAFAAGTFCKVAEVYAGGAAISALNNVCRNLSFEYFGWFASGAAFYVYSKSGNYRWLLGATALAILSSAFVRAFHWPTFVVACLVSLFFAASLVSLPVRRVLQHGFFQFFGFISYPLYLMQENMMISMLAKLGDANLGLPAYLYPVLPVALLSATAYFVARHIEPNFRKAIVGLALKRPFRRAA